MLFRSPIVGLRTEIQKEGLYIDPQWGSTFILVAICVIGRFLINLNSQRSEKINVLSKFSSGVSNFFSGKGKQFAITGILFRESDSVAKELLFNEVSSSVGSVRNNSEELIRPI